jgi:hypothetical protein
MGRLLLIAPKWITSYIIPVSPLRNTFSYFKLIVCHICGRYILVELQNIEICEELADMRWAAPPISGRCIHKVGRTAPLGLRKHEAPYGPRRHEGPPLRGEEASRAVQPGKHQRHLKFAILSMATSSAAALLLPGRRAPFAVRSALRAVADY